MKVQGIPLPLSQSCRDANPAIFTLLSKKNALQGTEALRRYGQMNKTEAEFALILESQKQKGEILRYIYEGITLRFAGVKYTPDFVVFGGPSNQRPFMPKQLKFIEVKGPFIRGNRERAVERFRHAKTYYPEFQFEMWQKKYGSWKQII